MESATKFTIQVFKAQNYPYKSKFYKMHSIRNELHKDFNL